MANCKYIIKSFDGETILTIENFDADNALISFDNYYNSLSEQDKAKLLETIGNAKNSEELIMTIDEVLDLINEGYDVEYNHNILNDSQDDEIRTKLEFLKSMGISPSVVEVDKLSYDNKTNIEGVALSGKNKNKAVIFLSKIENDFEKRQVLNHELSHLVYDQAVKSNISGVGDLLNALWNRLKITSEYKTLNDDHLKKIFKRLESYGKGSDISNELFSWLFGDQKMYEFIKNISDIELNNIREKILDIIPLTPKGKIQTRRITTGDISGINFKVSNNKIHLTSSYNRLSQFLKHDEIIKMNLVYAFAENDEEINTLLDDFYSILIEVFGLDLADVVIRPVEELIQDAKGDIIFNDESIPETSFAKKIKQLSTEFIDFANQDLLRYRRKGETTYDDGTEIGKNDWKDRAKKIKEVLDEHLEKVKANDTYDMAYQQYRQLPKDKPGALFKLPMGSLVGIPYFSSKSVEYWRNILGNHSEALGITKDMKDDLWVDISFTKLHDYFLNFAIPIGSDLEKLMDYVDGKPKGENGKARWEIVKYQPFAYVGLLDNGDPYVAVPVTVTYLSKETDSKGKRIEKSFVKMEKFDANDIQGYRKYVGDYNTRANISDYDNTDLEDLLTGLNAKIQYEKPKDGEKFDWDGNGNPYVTNIEFQTKKGGSFVSTRFKKGVLSMTGKFGELVNVVDKTANAGDFVKASIGYNKDTKEHTMVYGKIVGKGGGGFEIIYRDDNDGGKFKTAIVSFGKITQLIINDSNQQSVSEALNLLDPNSKDNSKLSNELYSLKFSEAMKLLYDANDKTKFIIGMGYMELQIIKNNTEDGVISISQDEITQRKYFALKKAKRNSIVKYNKKEKGVIKSLVGTLFFVDEKFAYVKQSYDNSLIKIPIQNSPGLYSKSSGLIEGFNIIDNNLTHAAIDTVFSDQTREVAYLDYLNNIKKTIKNNKVSESGEYTPRIKKTYKELTEVDNLSPLQALKVLREQDSELVKSMEEVVNIHRFRSINVNRNTETGVKTVESHEQLLSDYEINRELSRLKEGDLILYYDIYGENDTLFERWEIITGFDENTGLPITAHRNNNGRISNRIIKPENVKAIGTLLNPYTSEDGLVTIAGRPEVIKKRLERKLKYVESLKRSYTKELADELVSKTNAKFKEGARVRYKAVPLIYTKADNGEFYFSHKNNVSKEPLPEGVEQLYKIVKEYGKQSGSSINWSTSTFSEKEFMMEMPEIYDADMYDFDTVKAGVYNGSIIRMHKEYTRDGKTRKVYYDMYVDLVFENEIRGSVIWTDTDDDGEVILPSFNVSIYRTGKIPTVIHGVYNAKYGAFKKEDKQKERRGNSITALDLRTDFNNIKSYNQGSSYNFSKNFKDFAKSTDTLKQIKTASDKLASLYGVESLVITNDEMTELGNSLAFDASDVRGLTVDGKIYINGDKASVAEAFHEMGHLILPGLKAMKSDVWQIIAQKVKEHPAYAKVAEKYNTLSEEDLVDETFLTIFGEYYRSVYLSQFELDWYNDNPEFDDFTDSSQDVIETLFDVNVDQKIATAELMKMSLNQFMKEFGDAMLHGNLVEYFVKGSIITKNVAMSKLYQKLIDSGNIIKYC